MVPTFSGSVRSIPNAQRARAKERKDVVDPDTARAMAAAKVTIKEDAKAMIGEIAEAETAVAVEPVAAEELEESQLAEAKVPGREEEPNDGHRSGPRISEARSSVKATTYTTNAKSLIALSPTTAQFCAPMGMSAMLLLAPTSRKTVPSCD